MTGRDDGAASALRRLSATPRGSVAPAPTPPPEASERCAPPEKGNREGPRPGRSEVSQDYGLPGP